MAKFSAANSSALLLGLPLVKVEYEYEPKRNKTSIELVMTWMIMT